MNAFNPSFDAVGGLGRWLPHVAAVSLHWVKSAFRSTASVPITREPRNAAEVLVWAHSLEDVDPGLSADLRAMALRAWQ